MKSLKEQYIEAHTEIMVGWKTGDWPFNKKYVADCPLCDLINKEEGYLNSKNCCFCTQHDGFQKCIHMETFTTSPGKGSVQPKRAEYHRRVVEFLKTQPRKRFHTRNVMKSWPELFEIDRQVAEGE